MEDEQRYFMMRTTVTLTGIISHVKLTKKKIQVLCVQFLQYNMYKNCHSQLDTRLVSPHK